MKRISSKEGVHLKRIFPIFWCGALGIFAVLALVGGGAKTDLMFLVIPCAMAAFGLFLMKVLAGDLVDEVFDCDDYLLVRNRRVETQIPLSEIMNVSTSFGVNPPRITLRLTTEHQGFGLEVKFTPVRGFTLNPFAKDEIAEDIMARAYRARSGGAV